MTRLCLTSKTWQKSPSEILKINDEYTAYCLDEAAAYFWNSLKNEAVDDNKSNLSKKKLGKGKLPNKNKNMLNFLMKKGKQMGGG